MNKNILEMMTFIKETLTRFQIPYEENFSYCARGRNGKIYRQEFAFKIGKKKIYYVDVYPNDVLSWYDKDKDVSKYIIYKKMQRLQLQIGINLILIDEDEDKRIVEAILKRIANEEGKAI